FDALVALAPGNGVVPVDLAQVDGDEAGLPVVDVEHVGPEVEQAEGFQDGPAEVDEAGAVVGAVAAAALGGGELVEAAAGGRVVAAEVVALLDEVDRHAAVGQGGAPQAARDHLVADGDAEGVRRAFEGAAGGAGAVVEGEDD